MKTKIVESNYDIYIVVIGWHEKYGMWNLMLCQKWWFYYQNEMNKKIFNLDEMWWLKTSAHIHTPLFKQHFHLQRCVYKIGMEFYDIMFLVNFTTFTRELYTDTKNVNRTKFVFHFYFCVHVKFNLRLYVPSESLTPSFLITFKSLRFR